ncbi:MAG: PIG-L family deacetylase [Psychroflexus sp.]|nr:PIG-L family deacetylase [Psychroflexus sp.]
MNRSFILWVSLLFIASLNAQKPQPPDAYQIKQNLRSLNFLGKVLYVAAHPDDENTAMIAYFANKYGASTAYLSLTRGDGGQNLIGPELGEKLGVIRTQELLAARRIDGGRQFFTKAIDFGYSKKATETFQVWGKDNILKDVVRTFRKFKPDIVINRFDHRSRGRTHGHHTASAILSEEAFTKAAGKNVFPEQLDDHETWQPKRQFFNTSWWFYGSKEAFKKADKSNFLKVDIGEYFPLRGLSTNEIAAVSRSQHKSQGFGNISDRGSEFEYIELINGDLPESKDPFEGINTTWSRIEGGRSIGKILNPLVNKIDHQKPWQIVPELMKALPLIQDLPDEHWRKLKTQQVRSLIRQCLGLYLEASTDRAYANPEEQVKLDLEVTNRSPIQLKLTEVQLSAAKKLNPNAELNKNEQFKESITINIPADAHFSTPYWLEKPAKYSVYNIPGERSPLQPVEEPQFQVKFKLMIDGEPISFEQPIYRKFRDRVAGEVIDPFFIHPKASVAFSNEVDVFKNKKARQVEVKLKSYTDQVKGQLRIKNTAGWEVSPKSHQVTVDQKEDEMSFSFQVKPGKVQEVRPEVELVLADGTSITKKIEKIDYDHIPKQNLVLNNTSTWVNLDVKTADRKVAYIPGVGDFLPNAMANLNYEVSVLPIETVSAEKLSAFDVVVLGIRAYNVHPSLKFKNQLLFDFVKNGGTLINQYNKSRNLITQKVAPYELQLSYNRVTEESAEVDILEPDHPIFNSPNSIKSKDLENWVQEIGLYFPDGWADEFKALLAAHDTGEEDKKGILLVADHGKGKFIYTGLSLFRQLPEGVPGAYRLLANLIAY